MDLQMFIVQKFAKLKKNSWADTICSFIGHLMVV